LFHWAEHNRAQSAVSIELLKVRGREKSGSRDGEGKKRKRESDLEKVQHLE